MWASTPQPPWQPGPADQVVVRMILVFEFAIISSSSKNHFFAASCGGMKLGQIPHRP
jgi:hypothetical protein